MKILLVSNGYPPRGKWGTEFYTRALVRGLQARGHELFVLHPVRSGARPRYHVERVQEDGVEITLIHNAGDPAKGFRSSYADAQIERLFQAELERIGPDVCHFTYLLWGLSAGLVQVARSAGVAPLITLTDYGLLCHRGQMFDWRLESCGGPHPADVCARCVREPAPFDYAPFELTLRRWAVRSMAALGGLGKVVQAEDLERREAEIRAALDAALCWIAPTASLGRVFERAGFSGEKLVQLVYSFDEGPYRAVRGPGPDEVRFGFFGQFAPHKGLATLIEAARGLEKRHGNGAFEVVLFGAPSSGRHREYASRVLADLPASVRLGEVFSPEEAPRVLSELSAIVLPSEWDENAPLSLLQARAAGVPSLASDVAGMREVCRPGEHGELFPPGDVASLTDCMQRVLTGEIGRLERPGLPLSLDDHLTRVEALYERAMRSVGAHG